VLESSRLGLATRFCAALFELALFLKNTYPLDP